MGEVPRRHDTSVGSARIPRGPITSSLPNHPNWLLDNHLLDRLGIVVSLRDRLQTVLGDFDQVSGPVEGARDLALGGRNGSGLSAAVASAGEAASAPPHLQAKVLRHDIRDILKLGLHYQARPGSRKQLEILAYHPFLRNGNPVIERDLPPALLRFDRLGNHVVKLGLGQQGPGTDRFLRER